MTGYVLGKCGRGYVHDDPLADGRNVCPLLKSFIADLKRAEKIKKPIDARLN